MKGCTWTSTMRKAAMLVVMALVSGSEGVKWIINGPCFRECNIECLAEGLLSHWGCQRECRPLCVKLNCVFCWSKQQRTKRSLNTSAFSDARRALNSSVSVIAEARKARRSQNAAAAVLPPEALNAQKSVNMSTPVVPQGRNTRNSPSTQTLLIKPAAGPSTKMLNVTPTTAPPTQTFNVKSATAPSPT